MDRRFRKVEGQELLKFFGRGGDGGGDDSSSSTPEVSDVYGPLLEGQVRPGQYCGPYSAEWYANGGQYPSDSSSGGSDDSSGGNESSGLSSLEKDRVDAAVTARELAQANSLLEQNIPYSRMDCSHAMAEVTGLEYKTTAQLIDPATRAAAGYEDAVGNTEAGTWTVVRYVDKDTGQEVGHAQMTMGNGQYFDSTDGDKRNGPSTTTKPTLDWLQENGYEIREVAYMRPQG